jgi:hypothetical protein
LVLGTAPVTDAAPSGAEPRSSISTTVALVTGDQETMRGDMVMSVRPGKGREKMSFSTLTAGEHVPVTPKLEAKLNHPTGATSVSLRASATDRDGNTVKQTIIKAYTLK